MVSMGVEHEVWITFSISISIFLSQNLNGNVSTHKNEVLIWYTSQSLDKRHVLLLACWYLNRDHFLKGEVYSYTLRNIFGTGF